jgi:hypothetical protein
MTVSEGVAEWNKSAATENNYAPNPRRPASGLHPDLYSHKRCRREVCHCCYNTTAKRGRETYA